MAARIDERPATFLPVWVLAYLAVTWHSFARPLWYDELLTYYGASAPNVKTFAVGITHFDFNPPLLYGLVRLSLFCLGDSPFAVRLPSILAFLAAGLIVFCYARRAGGGYALTSVGLVWSGGFLVYATEARPYALMLTFFALAFFCWTEALHRDRWSVAHNGLTIAIAGSILTHCFAPVFALSIACGELARNISNRRFDPRIWIALGMPMPLLVIYLPLLGRPAHFLYPSVFQARWSTLWDFYGAVFIALLLPFVSMAVVIFLYPPSGQRNVASRFLRPIHESVFILSGLFIPALLIAYSIHANIPYWTRYGIAIAVPGALLCLKVFRFLTGCHPAAGVSGASALLLYFCFSSALYQRAETVRPSYSTIPPGLPIVVANGGRFLEMDHDESQDIGRRLYYLTDYEAAVRYAHTNIFEDFSRLKDCYPIRGTVKPYGEFVASHGRFLVVSMRNHPQDWLIAKLKVEGAGLLKIGNTPYGELIQVTLSDSNLNGQRSSHL